jgi:hypothetical protein
MQRDFVDFGAIAPATRLIGLQADQNSYFMQMKWLEGMLGVDGRATAL